MLLTEFLLYRSFLLFCNFRQGKYRHAIVPVWNTETKVHFGCRVCHTRCWLLNDSSFRLSTPFVIQFLHIVLFSVISFWRYTPLLTNPPGHEASPKLILWGCLKVNLPPYPHTSCKRLQITTVVFLKSNENTNLMQHCAGFISAGSLYMFRAQAPIIRSI